MPIEIKELHIRVSVSGDGSGGAKKPATGAAAKGEESAGHGAAKDEIVAECVEQVLQILQARRER
jgi:hypothetical protein